MTLTNLLVFALALCVAAGSPGPSIAALVARVLTNGLRDVLPFLAAMWLGEALWLGCAVAGLAVVARTLGVVFLAIKLIGVAYLLYLAWKMWFAPTEVSKGELPSGQSAWRMFGAGLTVTLGNPKIMVFYLALLPTIVDLDRVRGAAWLELTAVTLVVLDDRRPRLGAAGRARAPLAHEPQGGEDRQPHQRDDDGRRGGGDRRALGSGLRPQNLAENATNS